jgi:hypothetical protein
MTAFRKPGPVPRNYDANATRQPRQSHTATTRVDHGTVTPHPMINSGLVVSPGMQLLTLVRRRCPPRMGGARLCCHWIDTKCEGRCHADGVNSAVW